MIKWTLASCRATAATVFREKTRDKQQAEQGTQTNLATAIRAEHECVAVVVAELDRIETSIGKELDVTASAVPDLHSAELVLDVETFAIVGVDRLWSVRQPCYSSVDTLD